MRKSNKIELTPISNKAPTLGAHIDFIKSHCILPTTRELITLFPYQLELIEEWFAPDTKAHLTVIGAGNAKTTTLAAYITAHIFLTYEASVPVVAETVRQASDTTWGVVKRFCELDPELDKRVQILEGQGTRRGVYVPGVNSHCFPVADRPAGLQGLNPSIAVLEEASEATVETYYALSNRLGKRQQSKLIAISTPSFTEDNALLYIQRKFRAGEPPHKTVLKEYISPQKDITDESQWHLANPALAAGILDIDAIRADLESPEMRFRAYRLCQDPVGSESCWLNALDQDSGDELGDAYEIWQRGNRTHTFQLDAPIWVGVDVSKSHDHTSVVWGQYTTEGKLHTKCRIWTPDINGNMDLEDIASHLHDLKQRYEVKEIWYDPSYFYNASQLAKTLPMVEVPPSTARMAPIVGHAYHQIRKGLVTHDDDRAFMLNVLNAQRHYCPQGFTIEKRKYERKIDAAIALCLCIGAASMPQTVRPPLDALRFHRGKI